MQFDCSVLLVRFFFGTSRPFGVLVVPLFGVQVVPCTMALVVPLFGVLVVPFFGVLVVPCTVALLAFVRDLMRKCLPPFFLGSFKIESGDVQVAFCSFLILRFFLAVHLVPLVS